MLTGYILTTNYGYKSCSDGHYYPKKLSLRNFFILLENRMTIKGSSADETMRQTDIAKTHINT